MTGQDKKAAIPYAVIDKYVGVMDIENASALMLKHDYLSLEQRLMALPPSSKALLGKICDFDRQGAQTKRVSGAETRRHPLDLVTDKERQSFYDDMEDNALSSADQRVQAVYLDIKAGKPGFKTPVYSVNGHPVLGTHFDATGKLAEHVARIYAPETLLQRQDKAPGSPLSPAFHRKP